MVNTCQSEMNPNEVYCLEQAKGFIMGWLKCQLIKGFNLELLSFLQLLTFHDIRSPTSLTFAKSLFYAHKEPGILIGRLFD